MEQARPAVENAMQRMDKGVAEGPCEADWESLKTYPVAEWLREADDAARTVEARFRITGRRPELWDPVTGEGRGLPEDVTWAMTGFGTALLKVWPDWLTGTRPRSSGRYTFTSLKHWTEHSPLLPSGLLGPVTI